MEFDPDCEAMVFTTGGTPLQGKCSWSFILHAHLRSYPGITGGSGGDRRVEFIIPPADRKKGSLDVVIEVSCNGMFGVPPGDIIRPPEVLASCLND